MAFHNVLVPLDGSVSAEQAVATAAVVARANGATLHLVLVDEAEPGPRAGDSRGGEPSGGRGQRIVNLATEVREQFGIAVATALRAGPVAAALESYVFRDQVDLIVMTSHGRTGWRRAWAGSIADELAHRVSVPLLLLRLNDDQATSAPMHLRRILVALDGSHEAEAAIAVARGLDPAAPPTIVLGRIVPSMAMDIDMAQSPGVMLPDLEATQRLVGAATRYVNGVADQLATPGAGTVEVAVEVAPLLFRPSPVAPTMASLARRVRADLVALTTHERGISRLFIGSVADRILRSTHCALLICHGDRRAVVRSAVPAAGLAPALAGRT